MCEAFAALRVFWYFFTAALFAAAFAVGAEAGAGAGVAANESDATARSDARRIERFMCISYFDVSYLSLPT
jgi:hypothetical protein